MWGWNSGLPEAFTGTVNGTLIVEGTNALEIRIPVRLVGATETGQARSGASR